MNEQQLQTEYEQRMTTDTAFRAIEEQLNHCFAQRGHVRKPYWERWTGKLSLPPLSGETRVHRPPIQNRKIVCVETGEVFADVNVLASKLNARRNSIYSAICKDHAFRGQHYRYATEAEKGTL